MNPYNDLSNYTENLGNNIDRNSLSDSTDVNDVYKVKNNQNVSQKSRVRYGWDVMFACLIKYGEIHGHYNVPRRYVCELPESSVSSDGVKSINRGKLGSWLTTQRIERANGRLKPERLIQLESLAVNGKFDWSPTNHFKQSETSWPYMFRCLVDFCESRSASAEVSSIPERKRWIHPDSKIEVGLGRWMHTQNKRRRIGKLRADRLAMLQDLVDAGKFRWPQIRAQKIPKPNTTSSGLSVINDSVNNHRHLNKNLGYKQNDINMLNNPIDYDQKVDHLDYSSDYDSDSGEDILNQVNIPSFEGVGVDYSYSQSNQMYVINNSTHKDTSESKHNINDRNITYYGERVDPNQFDHFELPPDFPVNTSSNNNVLVMEALQPFIPTNQHLMNVFNDSHNYSLGKRMRNEDNE